VLRLVLVVRGDDAMPNQLDNCGYYCVAERG
jgi:hypothetical protein